MEYGLNQSATRFELSRHVEIARTCLRQVGNQVCDQVCDLDSIMEFSQSRSQTSSRTSSRAGSLAGLRFASELDSVMEFGLKTTTITITVYQSLHCVIMLLYCRSSYHAIKHPIIYDSQWHYAVADTDAVPLALRQQIYGAVDNDSVQNHDQLVENAGEHVIELLTHVTDRMTQHHRFTAATISNQLQLPRLSHSR